MHRAEQRSFHLNRAQMSIMHVASLTVVFEQTMNQSFLETTNEECADVEPILSTRNPASSTHRAITKLNLRLTTICCCIIFFAYMDRGNLGFAANDMCDDLKLTHTEYGTGVSLFYAGYFLSQVLSNEVLKRVGGSLWLSIILGAWGLIAAGFAFLQSAAQFYVLRLLLGLAEGGTFPGIWYYLSLFFPDKYVAQPYAWTIASVIWAIPLSAPIAAALLQLDGLFGVAGWRHLFFFEGVMPMLFAIIVFVMLPDTIEKATFLTEEERMWLTSEKGLQQEQNHEVLSLFQELKIVSGNLRFWILAFICFFISPVFHTLSYWITLIISDSLYDDDDDDEDEDDDTCASSDNDQTLAIFLTLLAFVLSGGFIFIGQRLNHLFRHTIKLVEYIQFFGAICLALWVLAKEITFVLGFFSLVVALGIYAPTISLILALVPPLFHQSSRSAAFSVFNTIGMMATSIIPPIMGAIVDAKGYSLGVPLLGTLYLISGIICFMTKHKFDDIDPVQVTSQQ